MARKTAEEKARDKEIARLQREDGGGRLCPAGAPEHPDRRDLGRDRSILLIGDPVNAVRIGLQVLLVLGGLFLTMLILLHKGKGGGLSDMFGGGMSSSLGGSSVAERNLDRITISVAVVWFTCIVGLGILDRFA